MIKWPNFIIIYTDGASRGNPGPASIGIYITDKDGNCIYQYSQAIGLQTNNFAEYFAVLKALEIVLENKISPFNQEPNQEYKPNQEYISNNNLDITIDNNNNNNNNSITVKKKFTVTNIKICSDSELLVKQFNGEYKVKSPSIKPLFLKCQQKINLFKQNSKNFIQFKHIKRELNKKADSLANQALDSHHDNIIKNLI